jgi:hypothetical protein
MYTTYCDFYTRGTRTSPQNGCGPLSKNLDTPAFHLVARKVMGKVIAKVLEHETLTSIKGSTLNTRDASINNQPHRTVLQFSYTLLRQLRTLVSRYLCISKRQYLRCFYYPITTAFAF